MKLNLKAYQQHYTAQGFTYPKLFCDVTLTRKNRLSPWLVESNSGLYYDVGDKFDWCLVKLNQSYFIEHAGYKFKIETEVIK